MKALVTRPEGDAAVVVKALSERGIEALSAPLLRIVPAADGGGQLAGALAGVQAVLFTSANGVRAFARVSGRLELPAFCVGAASAAAARLAGFRTVFNAAGDVAALAELVAARLAPGNGALLHAAGEVTAGDLGAALGAGGFAVRRVVLYRAEPATELPGAAAAALRQGEIALALFFSPRTAATFVRLARDEGIDDACRRVTALALSPQVATALEAVPWRDVAIAAAPDLPALLAALDRVLSRPAESGTMG